MAYWASMEAYTGYEPDQSLAAAENQRSTEDPYSNGFFLQDFNKPDRIC